MDADGTLMKRRRKRGIYLATNGRGWNTNEEEEVGAGSRKRGYTFLRIFIKCAILGRRGEKCVF